MATPKIDPIFAQTFQLEPRKGDLRKFAIIQASVQCLSADAMEGGVFDRIGKRLKIRRTLVAYYFKSKDDLLEAAVQYVIANAQQMTIARIEGATSAEDRFLGMVEGAFDWMEQHPEQARVLMLFHYSAGSRKNHRKLNSAIRRAGFDRICAILREEPRTARARRTDQEITELARGLQLELMAFICDSVITDTTGLREVARANCRRRLAAFFTA